MPCMPEISNETRLKNPQVWPCFPTNMQPQTRSAAGCLLSDMKTHQLPVTKTTQGKIGLKTPDIWCIPCGCGKVYVRQAGVQTRCKEHMRHLFLDQPENLAVAEHIMGTRQQEIQQRVQNG